MSDQTYVQAILILTHEINKKWQRAPNGAVEWNFILGSSHAQTLLSITLFLNKQNKTMVLPYESGKILKFGVYC